MTTGLDVLLAGGSQAGSGLDVLLGSPAHAAAAAQIDNDAISQGARSSAPDSLAGRYLSTLGGLVRGAGSIGATVMRPFESAQDNAQRRSDMDHALSQLGADPNSLLYKGGKLGAEVAGTLGVGGAFANGARAVLPAAGMSAPAVDAVATALQTGGFRAPGLTGIPQLATRIGAGAVTGGAAAGMVDPSATGTGALIGGALPPATQAVGAVGQAITDAMRGGSGRLMQSALKPTIAQLKSGDADVAIQTMLQNGISPTQGGLAKLQGLVDAADSNLTNAIQGSSATIDKANVLGPLAQTRAQFASQVAPQGDLNAIDAVASSFLNHPQHPGMALPVQDAQALKQGTYQILAKKYGQLGSADTEAQKALALGLKDEIAAAVPAAADANAQLSTLLRTKGVVERRALMEANKNPLGLAALSPTAAGLLGFLTDRSGVLKALAARGLYTAAPLARAPGLLDTPMLLPAVRSGLLATEANP